MMSQIVQDFSHLILSKHVLHEVFIEQAQETEKALLRLVRCHDGDFQLATGSQRRVLPAHQQVDVQSGSASHPDEHQAAR